MKNRGISVVYFSIWVGQNLPERTFQYIPEIYGQINLDPSNTVTADYIGILGPSKRAKQLLDEMLDELSFTCEITNRVYRPVGLFIRAENSG